MPPLPAVPNAIRINFTFNDSVRTVGSRLFWTYTGGPPSAADCIALATSISGAFGTHLAASMPSGYTLAQVEVQDLSSASGNIGIFGTPVAGGRSGQPQSIGVAAVIDFVINRKYRGGKPKVFFPFGVAADGATPATWTTAFTDGLNTAWGAFTTEVAGFSSGSTTLGLHVNISYYDGYNTATPPWRGPGYKYPPKLRVTPVVDTITTYNARPRMGTQRRRTNSA